MDSLAKSTQISTHTGAPARWDISIPCRRVRLTHAVITTIHRFEPCQPFPALYHLNAYFCMVGVCYSSASLSLSFYTTNAKQFISTIYELPTAHNEISLFTLTFKHNCLLHIFNTHKHTNIRILYAPSPVYNSVNLLELSPIPICGSCW